MTRQEAAFKLRTELNHFGLTDWSVRLNQNPDSKFLGLCSYKDKCIILSAHHIDIHPTEDVINTIFHEIAHALCPYQGHNDVWKAKAKEIGCDNTLPCSNLSLSPEIIDAIRSGADVEVTFEEHVIRTPKYQITRLQDKCEACGKVAVLKAEKLIENPNPDKPDIKLITLECGHTYTRKIPKGTPFHMFQWDGDPLCDHTWVKSKCVKCDRKKPYPFQIEGMKFLEAGLSVNKGCAIFDQMALGKTVQAGGVIFYHPELCSPTLWVVKSGLIYQTFSFIVNTMDQIPSIVKTSKDWLVPGYKHYIIGYDMMTPKTRTLKSGTIVNSGFDIKQFDRIGIKCVVLDECQQIKNVDSSRTQMIRRVVRDRKVIPLSGTPWNNRGTELFPVLNMMSPVKFPSAEKFKRQWVATYWQGPHLKEGGIKNIPAFKEYTKDLCIRRERDDVMPELPKTNRVKLNIVMTEKEEEEYDEVVGEFVKWYEEEKAGMSGMAIIAAMARMRHIVAVAKIPATEEYIAEFIEETDRKIVVFAHHQDVQAILYEDLKAAYDRPAKPGETDFVRIPVMQHIAELSAEERFATQERFNAAPRAIMVASQLASGEGANWQTCSDCVMHERQWNPGKEEQCEDRFPRPGTTATSINAVYAHLDGVIAIDAQLDAIVERKRIQYHNTMNKGEQQKWNEDSIMKELAEAIVSAYRRKHAA